MTSYSVYVADLFFCILLNTLAAHVGAAERPEAGLSHLAWCEGGGGVEVEELLLLILRRFTFGWMFWGFLWYWLIFGGVVGFFNGIYRFVLGPRVFLGVGLITENEEGLEMWKVDKKLRDSTGIWLSQYDRVSLCFEDLFPIKKQTELLRGIFLGGQPSSPFPDSGQTMFFGRGLKWLKPL